MAEHMVDVVFRRSASFAAECRDCTWRSRRYRNYERACEEADKHAALTKEES